MKGWRTRPMPSKEFTRAMPTRTSVAPAAADAAVMTALPTALYLELFRGKRSSAEECQIATKLHMPRQEHGPSWGRRHRQQDHAGTPETEDPGPPRPLVSRGKSASTSSQRKQTRQRKTTTIKSKGFCTWRVVVVEGAGCTFKEV